MPRVLSESDVAEFRERLCAVAERLFATKGADAVTMRQLAAELGVSAMTPYRYFADKDEILAAIRTNGFNHFIRALTEARETQEGSRARGKAMGEAYMDFAFEHPHTYKLMFDLNQPGQERYPDLIDAIARATETLSDYIRDHVAEGVLEGDAEEIGAMFWASTHGAIVLELAGQIPPGRARELHGALNKALARGLRPS